MRIMILLIVMIMAPTMCLFAEMKPKPVKSILSEIRDEQSVKSDDKIIADKVSPARLEELGESVMETMIGDSERHEQMDEMMGGEGSASLSAMHQRIGYNYLSGYPVGMMNMMSGGMMGFRDNKNFTHGGRFMMNGNYPWMMGNSGWGFGGLFMGLFFLIVLAVAVFFVYKLVKSGHLASSGDTPMEILKKRYAKGEITKEEFEKIKKDIAG